MQVFRDAVEKNGGPLPLAYYLQPDAGGTVDEGPLQLHAAIDLLNTRVDRQNFFESLLHDKNFAILSTFLVSGVSANAMRDEDGATALHVAAAATLDMLNEDTFMSASGDGSSTGAAATASGGAAGRRTSMHAPDTVELEEDARHRSDHVLNALCQNQLILSFLIDNGADVNAPMRSRLRLTPLMVAAARQNIKASNLLLAKGADMYAQDALGRTALTYAARYPLLLETFRVWMGEENFFKGAVRERLLHTVCRTVGNHYAALYLMEEVHLDVNARDYSVAERSNGYCTAGPNGQQSPVSSGAAAPMPSYRRSPITTACAAARFPTAAVAAGHLSPASGAGNDNSGHTHSATVVEMTNTVSYNGDTPLHCAVSTGDVALVRVLLSKGADVHAENGSGMSPLRLSQSQSQVGPSVKQYWRENLLLLLRPGSAAAMAVRRRRLDGRDERDPAKVRAIITAFNNATPGPSREKVVQEETVQYIWQSCTSVVAYAQLAATLILPHLLYYVWCCINSNFFLLLCPLPLLYSSYIGTLHRDGRRACSRPLASLGWLVGYIAAQGVCLGFFTSHYYYKYYSFHLESHRAISWWLIPSTTTTFVLFLYLVVFSSPGLVTTSEGQRKGIYASLRGAKGDYPKEMLYGIDLRTMVKKPLRAQYCVQLQRVVLRFDQYCAYISTVIGGGNQRVFFWAHVSLLALLSCFYYYALEYNRMMSRVADVAQTSGGVGGTLSNGLAQKLTNTPFTTAELRFGYMYTQAVLPIMMLMVVYALYNQICLIARNLTVYDLEHALDESSVYCFHLGSTIYTLYDRGMWANVREFVGWSSFTARVYRVPQMSPYLQKVVEDHQRWQLTSGDGCGCGDDHHGHSHGQGNGSHSHSGATIMTHGERIGPAEYGDDESTRHKQMLEARQLQALAGAAGGGGPSVPPGRPAFAAPHTSKTFSNMAVTEAVQQQQPLQVEAAEGGYDDDGEEGGGDAPANSNLDVYIFQQMVRSGSTDIGRSERPSQGSNDGADAETQREWDAAVQRARQMFEFYRQSLGVQEGED